MQDFPKPFTEMILKKYPEQSFMHCPCKEKINFPSINPITLGWTMITSHEPPMMAFSVGLRRYSLGVLREAKECVIAFPSELQVFEETLLFDTKRKKRDTGKLELSGIKTVPAASFAIVSCSMKR